MRVWEFEDNKAIPSDLVREQDFILRVRRMQRHGSPHLVLNFILNAIEPLAKNQTLLEAAQKKLDGYARATAGSYSEMSNGDVFIVWERPGDPGSLASRAIEAALSDYAANVKHFLLAYRMPENYAVLRERTNYYVEAVRAAAAVGAANNAAADSTGQMTAKNLDQIEQLLNEIDLRRYGRTQSFYGDKAGKWTAQGEEYFISFEDLRRERFPRLDIGGSDHFFFALCGYLDQKLLAMLTTSFDTIANRTINLNLSIATIVGNVFTQFVRRVPREARQLIGFELHRGDLFQDFALTLSAIEVLKREGFRVLIDAVTPDMIGYLNLDAFNVDAVKINVSKDRALQLEDPKVRAAITKLPAKKVVFFRCDNDRALAIGRELGVQTFQGWLIDDMAGKKS